MKDLLREVKEGDDLSAEQHNLMVRMLGAANLGAGTYVDGTGVYTRPIRRKAAAGDIRFELTAAFTHGGTATATILKWDPSTNSGDGGWVDAGLDEITVSDPDSEWPDADSGTKGWCRRYSSDNGPVYLILDLAVCTEG